MSAISCGIELFLLQDSICVSFLLITYTRNFTLGSSALADAFMLRCVIKKRVNFLQFFQVFHDVVYMAQYVPHDASGV